MNYYNDNDPPECECYDGRNPLCPVHGYAAVRAAKRERRELDREEMERDDDR